MQRLAKYLAITPPRRKVRGGQAPLVLDLPIKKTCVSFGQKTRFTPGWKDPSTQRAASWFSLVWAWRREEKMPRKLGSFLLFCSEFSVDSHVPPGEGYNLRIWRTNLRFEVLTARSSGTQFFVAWFAFHTRPSDKAQHPIIPELPRRFPQLLSRSSESTFRWPWNCKHNFDNFTFFKRLRKIAKSDYQFRHVCLSTRPNGKRPPTGRIFMKFGTRIYFESLSRKFNSH
jgi:hypothetical protein